MRLKISKLHQCRFVDHTVLKIKSSAQWRTRNNFGHCTPPKGSIPQTPTPAWFPENINKALTSFSSMSFSITWKIYWKGQVQEICAGTGTYW